MLTSKDMSIDFSKGKKKEEYEEDIDALKEGLP